MQERTAQLTRERELDGLTICTFHALGLKMLRAEAQVLGLKPRFSILDADDAFGILAELTGSVEKQSIRRAQWQISAWKNALVSPDAAESLADSEQAVAAARVYRNYDLTLRAYQAVDFDDLIL